MNNTEKKISKLLSSRLIIVIGTIIVPLILLNVIGSKSDIDPFIIFSILAVGFIIGAFIIKKSLESTIIPYLLLQMVFFWILIDFIYLGSIGLNLKLYAMSFALSLLIAAYQVMKNFKYLWSNFPVFRYLLIFFLISIPYFLFYHSDFRTSTYPEIWFAKVNQATQQTHSFTYKTFRDDSSIAMYLVSICPIVAAIISLMLFHGLNTFDMVNERLIKIIKWITYGFVAYFFAAALGVILGLSHFSFETGRLVGNFYGSTIGFHIFISMFILLFIGFKYYINTAQPFKGQKLLNIALNFIIPVYLVLVLLQINKSSILGLVMALMAILFMNFRYSNIKSFFKDKRSGTRKIFIRIIQFLPLLLVLLLLKNSEFVSTTIFNIVHRFSSVETLNSRFMIWEYFIRDWTDKLDLIKFIFGFGADASLEKIFFISSMFARTDSLLSTHNIFIAMFYEYGLFAIFYFGAIVSVALNNLKIILSKNTDKNVRIFSNISLAIIIFFALYHSTDGLRIPIAILFFSMIGFLESAKFAYLRLYKENENKISEEVQT
ncbi:MAG: hypothetical protein ACD_20C00234G0012 [uncultured bacterium]|nr:MAG: hypothetical protein ACD_20C00234G0012 [uncultured bacterium]HBH18786.1 hypothetical protein [Cyanobacteria bacterium UBA9579]